MNAVATTAARGANQAPPLEGYDLYSENRPLVEAVAREGAAWADDSLRTLGTLLGGEPLELGRLANEHAPQLRTHDRFGNRIDEVEFHPAWHRLLGLGVEHALHASPWREPRAGAHVARAAGFLTLAQVEAGVGCPLSMTFASLATSPRSTTSGCRSSPPRPTSRGFARRTRRPARSAECR
jgi:putative acyl-CoA dehydrogenase